MSSGDDAESRFGDSWLKTFLQLAERKRFCVRIHCTTCGSGPFRSGLLEQLDRILGRELSLGLDREAAFALLAALRELEMPAAGIHRREVGRPDRGAAEDAAPGGPVWISRGFLREAIRMILYLVWSGRALVPPEMESELEGSFAGQVLQSMIEHERYVTAQRREHEERNDPERIRARREAKKRLRAEAHAKRVLEQQERSRRWHAEHSPRD